MGCLAERGVEIVGVTGRSIRAELGQRRRAGDRFQGIQRPAAIGHDVVDHDVLRRAVVIAPDVAVLLPLSVNIDLIMDEFQFATSARFARKYGPDRYRSCLGRSRRKPGPIRPNRKRCRRNNRS
jgi:hypothetical protein